jgi:phosphatidylglycerol:prolipoprotein diacylglycerol transferase
LHYVDNLNPVALHLGPLQIRWYGVMYALSFILGYYLISYLAPKRGVPLNRDGAAELIIYLAAGVLIGGRLGYVLFYNLPFYLRHPGKIAAVWGGGMSFHGGLIGVIIGGLLFSRKTRIGFWTLADLVVPLVPLGLFLGRIGNFINGELWGRPADVPWAIIFPNAPLIHGVLVARHPSQLYEAFLEGLVLFAVLWIFAQRRRPDGVIVGIFLIFYGLFRCFAEVYREPDPQLGLIGGFISMGQILSIPMILAGIGLIVWARHRSRASAATTSINPA